MPHGLQQYAGCARRAALPQELIPHRGTVRAVIRWRSEPPASTLAGVTRTIERVDPADGTAMRALYDVWSAAYLEHDPDNPLPTFPEIVARATAPHRSVVEEFWSLRDGDDVIGCLWLEMPTQDNLELAEVGARGPPAQPGPWPRPPPARAPRRPRARARPAPADHRGSGNRRRTSENRSTRFATAAGARRSLGEVRRTLDLTTVDRERLAAQRAEAEKHAPATSWWAGPARAPTASSTTTPRWSAA